MPDKIDKEQNSNLFSKFVKIKKNAEISKTRWNASGL